MARMTGKPIQVVKVNLRLKELELGFHGKSIDFGWCPYERRLPYAQSSFDRLVVSIFHRGILRPLITYRDHVLIGMRRAEIGLRLGIEFVDCLEVQEDVSVWGRDDVDRLNELKKKIGEVGY